MILILIVANFGSIIRQLLSIYHACDCPSHTVLGG